MVPAVINNGIPHNIKTETEGEIDLKMDFSFNSFFCVVVSIILFSYYEIQDEIVCLSRLTARQYGEVVFPLFASKRGMPCPAPKVGCALFAVQACPDRKHVGPWVCLNLVLSSFC